MERDIKTEIMKYIFLLILSSIYFFSCTRTMYYTYPPGKSLFIQVQSPDLINDKKQGKDISETLDKKVKSIVVYDNDKNVDEYYIVNSTDTINRIQSGIKKGKFFFYDKVDKIGFETYYDNDNMIAQMKIYYDKNRTYKYGNKSITINTGDTIVTLILDREKFQKYFPSYKMKRNIILDEKKKPIFIHLAPESDNVIDKKLLFCKQGTIAINSTSTNDNGRIDSLYNDKCELFGIINSKEKIYLMNEKIIERYDFKNDVLYVYKNDRTVELELKNFSKTRKSNRRINEFESIKLHEKLTKNN